MGLYSIAKLLRICDTEETRSLIENILINDGGPGSGNFGHKGRPGVRGGSGSGGGKQYRGGRSDIGYVGSRKDWLNGLTGTSQHKAVRFVSTKKREMETKLTRKAKVESLAERGIISKKQAEEFYKKDGSANLTKGMTTEEYVMKAGTTEDKEELINHVQGARQWNETANRLIKENWEDNDKKLASALADKYGRAFVGGSELPDDSHITEWDKEDRECWYDLKAKAMDIPNSGKEAPDELQYAAGIKERPAPPIPEPTGIPKNADENQNWFDCADERQQRLIREYLGKMGATPENFAGVTDMNEAESRIEQRIVRDLAMSHPENLTTWGDYLRMKEMVLGVDAKSILASGTSEYLSDEQKQAAKDLLAIGMGYDENHNPLDKVADIAEYGLMTNSEVPDYLKAYYLSLKARALGYGIDKDPESSLIEATWAKPIKDNNLIPMLKKRLTRESREKTATPEKYLEKKKQNAVVIQGDAFSEKINGMRKESGSYSVDEYKTIGEEMSKEIERSFGDISRQVELLKEEAKKKQEVYSQTSNLRNAIEGAGFTTFGEFYNSPAYKEYEEKREAATKEYMDATDKVHQAEEAYGQAVSEALKRVRKVGVQDQNALKIHMPGRSTVKQFVTDAYNQYPSEWCEQSFLRGIIHLKKVNRGYCSDDTIAISGTGKSAAETASHELGHRFERSVPGILEAERSFYESRTQGEKLQSLRRLTGIGYRGDERTKVDKFLNPYMGKDYNGRAYELVSMGFEMAFHRPQELMKDRDYANFIFGLLAVG